MLDAGVGAPMVAGVGMLRLRRLGFPDEDFKGFRCCLQASLE